MKSEPQFSTVIHLALLACSNPRSGSQAEYVLPWTCTIITA